MNNMRNIAVFLFIFVQQFLYSQLIVKKHIIDKQTKQPLVSVIIHNTNNYTLTNDDGLFVFYTIHAYDSISIKLLGYETIRTTAEQLSKEKDTLFLLPKPIELSEVVVETNQEILSQTYRKALENYPNEPFVEDFFLRTILKKNGQILKIEDIGGRVKRNKLLGLSKDLIVDFQILNMRKFGIENKDKYSEDFSLLSLREVFLWYSSLFFIDYQNFNFSTPIPIDDIHKKIAYFPKKNNFYDGEGYFVINTEDYSITERYHKINEEIIDKIPFTKKLWTKYRTSYYSLKEKCEKNIKGKYFIASVSLQQQVEVYNKSNKNNYDIEYQIIITLPFSDISTFKANVSSKKELFKLNFPYNKNFWEKQNQLPLTEEIQFFLDKAHNQKEYRIISNF